MLAKFSSPPQAYVQQCVRTAIAEDLGSGDVTASLVDQNKQSSGTVISREAAIICGRPWANEAFHQFSDLINLEWRVEEGDRVEADQEILRVYGPSRALLGAERTALNFLQLLSGTASETARYVERASGTQAKIVDTRKTVPGLRLAQKYAVLVGGGENHRIGLYDGFLIKENHVAAAGSLTSAVERARALETNIPLMAEAESLDQVREALKADIDVLLVDDFDNEQIRAAVEMARLHKLDGGRTLIEYSGGATLERIPELAACGVDRISVGSLTKHVRAIDLSLRFADDC